MKINITKKVGDSTILAQIDEGKDIDSLFQAASITSMPTVCTKCGSDNVELASNRAEGFNFVKVKCKKCKATANAGQYKEGGGVFWKDFEEFIPKDSEAKKLRKETGVTEEDLNEIFGDQDV